MQHQAITKFVVVREGNGGRIFDAVAFEAFYCAALDFAIQALYTDGGSAWSESVVSLLAVDFDDPQLDKMAFRYGSCGDDVVMGFVQACDRTNRTTLIASSTSIDSGRRFMSDSMMHQQILAAAGMEIEEPPAWSFDDEDDDDDDDDDDGHIVPFH